MAGTGDLEESDFDATEATSPGQLDPFVAMDKEIPFSEDDADEDDEEEDDDAFIDDNF